MRKLALAIGIYVMAVTGISVSTSAAWWDDSHGYRGLRTYGCGPPCGGGYFSGVKVPRVRGTLPSLPATPLSSRPREA